MGFKIKSFVYFQLEKSNPRSVLMRSVLELTLCTTCFPSRQGDKNIYMYNSCMYILSGVVSLCFQGKFLNMITGNVYINFLDYLLILIINLKSTSVSVCICCVYTVLHMLIHIWIWIKKISIKAVKYCKCVTIRNALLCMIWLKEV